jgi:hypothetical protein
MMGHYTPDAEAKMAEAFHEGWDMVFWVFGHMAVSKFGGDPIYFDTGMPVPKFYDGERSPYPCPKCNQFQTSDGHDPCISNLPGIEHACCGHGVEQGYLVFSDGRIFRGLLDEQATAARIERLRESSGGEEPR